jgi:hypothetical protein
VTLTTKTIIAIRSMILAASVILLFVASAHAQLFAEQDGVQIRFDDKCIDDTTTFPGNAGETGLVGCIVNNNDYYAQAWYTVDWACRGTNGRFFPRNNSKQESAPAHETRAIFADACVGSVADRPVYSVRITSVLVQQPPPPSQPTHAPQASTQPIAAEPFQQPVVPTASSQSSPVSALVLTPAQNPNRSGPSLDATMKFIQERLGDIGSVGYTAFYQNARYDSMTTTDEFSKVIADARLCQISFHRKKMYKPLKDNDEKDMDVITYDGDVSLSLRDIQEIEVKPMEQRLNDNQAATGHPETVVTSTRPAITALLVHKSHEVLYPFPFTDALLANRVAKAIVHAVELCGGGEPF